MARSYGRFTTSIWQDVDFTTLTQAQQGLYFTLGLQPDVTAAGLLSLTAGRWANLSADASRTVILAQLAELATHTGRHLIVDEDTEEVLIRTFMKWDGGWNNSKRLPVVIEAVCAIASVDIRRVAVDELRKIAASDATTDEQKRAREALSDAISGFDRLTLSPLPLTLNLNQLPTPGAVPANAQDEPPSMFCDEHPNGTTDPCGACARAREVYANAAQSKLDAEIEAKRIRAEAIAACPHCDPAGKRVDPNTQQVIARFCDHTAPEPIGADR
jgi:hypothetical protein